LLKAALKRPDAIQWLQATAEEMAAHKRNNSWEIVDLPHGITPVAN
jgi:hypothetical protein